MKKTFLLSIVLLSLLLAPLSSTLLAQMPLTMNYQSSLYNQQDKKPINGTYAMTFEIYDAEFGGNQVWSELQNVTVTDGLINVFLGSDNPLDINFDRPFWLQVTIGNGTPLPRSPLTMVPYSGSSKRANFAGLASMSDTSGIALDVPDGLIDLAKLADESKNVTGGDVIGTLPVLNIKDGAITEAKLSPNARAVPKGPAGGDLTGQYPDPLIAEGAITAGKIADGTIGLGKWYPSTGAAGTIIGWNGSEWVETTVSAWEVDGVIGNEVLGATMGRGLVRAGAGTASDPYTLGIGDAMVTGAMLAPDAVTGDVIEDGTITFDKFEDGDAAGQIIYWNAATMKWDASPAAAPQDDQILRWVDNGTVRVPQWTDEEGLKIPFAYKGTSTDANLNPQTMIELINTNGQNDITAHGVHVWMQGTGGSAFKAEGSGVDQNNQTNLPVVDINGNALLSYQDGALNVDVDINSIDGGNTKGAMITQNINSVNIFNSDGIWVNSQIDDGQPGTYHTGAYLRADVNTANSGGIVAGAYGSASGMGADVNAGFIGVGNNATTNFGVAGIANEGRSWLNTAVFPADFEAGVFGVNPEAGNNNYGVYGQIEDGTAALAGIAQDGYAVWGSNNSDTDATAWFMNDGTYAAVEAMNNSDVTATMLVNNGGAASAIVANNNSGTEATINAGNNSEGPALWAMANNPAPAIGTAINNATDYVANLSNTGLGRAAYMEGGLPNDQNAGMPIFADGADEDDATLVIRNNFAGSSPWATAIKTYGDIWANSTIGADVIAALGEIRIGGNPAGVAGVDYMVIDYVPGTEIVFMNNDVRINENLFVDKSADIALDLTVGNDATIGNDLSVGNDLTVDGTTTLNGPVVMAGPVTIAGYLEVDDFKVNNTSEFDGPMTVDGMATFNNTVDMNGAFTANALSTFNDDVVFNGSMVELSPMTELVADDAINGGQSAGDAGAFLISKGAGMNPEWGNTIPTLNATTVVNTADLNVTGDAVFTGTFDATGITGPALFTDITTDGIVVNTLLDVQGDAEVQGTADFYGAVNTYDMVTLNGTTGNVTFNNATDVLDITNVTTNFNGTNTNINGTTNDGIYDLDITGEVRINGGAANADYDLLVSGDAAVTGTIDNHGGIVNTSALLGGNVQVTDNFLVTGTSNLQGNVDADANVNVDGNLNVEGVITDTDGITNIDNALDVNGDITDMTDGLTTVANDFEVTGTSHLTGDVTADNNVDVLGNLDVTGTSNLQGNVTAGADLDVAGNSTFGTFGGPGNFVQLNNETELRAFTGAPAVPTAGNPGDLLVSRGAGLNPEWDNHLATLTVDDLFVDDRLVLGADGDGMDNPILEVLEGDVVINDNLVVSGLTTTFDGVVINDLLVGNDVLVGNDLDVTVDLSVGNDAFITNDLEVDGVTDLDVTNVDGTFRVLNNNNAFFNGAVQMDKTLDVNGQATVNSLKVTTDATIDQDLTVSGVSNLNGTVNINTANNQMNFAATGQTLAMNANNGRIIQQNTTAIFDTWGRIVNTNGGAPIYFDSPIRLSDDADAVDGIHTSAENPMVLDDTDLVTEGAVAAALGGLIVGDNGIVATWNGASWELDWNGALTEPTVLDGAGAFDITFTNLLNGFTVDDNLIVNDVTTFNGDVNIPSATDFFALSDGDQVNEVYTSLDGNVTVDPAANDQQLITALAVKTALLNLIEDGSGTTISDTNPFNGVLEVDLGGTLNKASVIDGAGAWDVTYQNLATGLTVDDNLIVNDDVTLGSDATDNVVFNADVDSHIIPNTDDTYDLGSPAQRWRDIYATGASVHIGNTVGTDELMINYTSGTTTASLNVNGTDILELTPALGTVNGDFNVTGNTDLDGDLNVDGDVSTLVGPFTIADDLNVNGNTDLDGTLNVDLTSNFVGNVNFVGTIATAGAGPLVVADDLDVDGNLNVDGTVGTSGAGPFVIADDLKVNGNTDLDGTLNVDLTSNFVGNADFDANITGGLDGEVTVDDDLEVTGNTDLLGTLNVSLTSNFVGNADFDADITGGADNIVNINNNLNVVGDADFDMNITGGLDNLVTINDNLNVTGTSDFDGNANFDGTVSTVGGDFTVDDNLHVTGTSDFDGNANFDGTVSTVGGDFTVDDNLHVTGTSDFDGNANFDGTVSTVGGNFIVDDNLDVTGNGDVTGDLNVDGNTTLNGDVDLGDAAADMISFNGVVDTDIIADADATRALGSDAVRWNEVFVNGTSLHVGPTGGLAGNTELMLNYNSGTNTAAVNVDAVDVMTATSAQVTFPVNVDASLGLDVTGADLTVANNAVVVGNVDVDGNVTNTVGGALEINDADGVNVTGLLTANTGFALTGSFAFDGETITGIANNTETPLLVGDNATIPTSGAVQTAIELHDLQGAYDAGVNTGSYNIKTNATDPVGIEDGGAGALQITSHTFNGGNALLNIDNDADADVALNIRDLGTTTAVRVQNQGTGFGIEVFAAANNAVDVVASGAGNGVNVNVFGTGDGIDVTSGSGTGMVVNSTGGLGIDVTSASTSLDASSTGANPTIVAGNSAGGTGIDVNANTGIGVDVLNNSATNAALRLENTNANGRAINVVDGGGNVKLSYAALVVGGTNALTVNSKVSVVNITSNNDGTNDAITLPTAVNGQFLYVIYDANGATDNAVFNGTLYTTTLDAQLTFVGAGGAWHLVSVVE